MCPSCACPTESAIQGWTVKSLPGSKAITWYLPEQQLARAEARKSWGEDDWTPSTAATASLVDVGM